MNLTLSTLRELPVPNVDTPKYVSYSCASKLTDANATATAIQQYNVGIRTCR